MKKIALLLALGLLAACGGGGGGSTSSNTQPVSSPAANGPTGTLSITVKSPSAKRTADDLSTTATWARIVVTNPSIKNSAGKLVQFTYVDYNTATPPSSISIPNIPVGSGYTVEIVEFYKKTTAFSNYSVMRNVGYWTGAHAAYTGYSAALVNIPATSQGVTPYDIINYDAKPLTMLSEGAHVTLVPKAVSGQTAIDLATPALYGGNKIPTNANLFSTLSTLYKMKVSFTTPSSAHIQFTPFKNSWILKQSYVSDPSSTRATSIDGSISSLLTGPAAYNASSVYQTNYESKGVFNLKDSLLRTGERATDFQFTSEVITRPLYTRMGSFI